jgi:intracellular septation protein
MKFLFDFFPLILFFAVYATKDIYYATGAAMVATVAQVAWSWLRHKKVDKLLWINFAAIMVFGGLTLWLHDERFIKVKPTIVYWIIAAGLLVAHFAFGKNAIRAMMEKHFDAPDGVWNRWLYAWAGLFAVLGILNLAIAFTLPTDLWVKFKVFGGIALTFAFAILQTWRLSPYARQDAQP